MATDLPSSPKPRWRVWIWGARVLAAVVAIVIVVVGVRWLAAFQVRPSGADQDLSLEAQWDSTIRRLGVDIEPVYPPQEDLSVGDLFATVVADDQRYPSTEGDRDGASGRPVKRIDASTPFLGKSVKLGHVDVSKELEATYSKIPVFPESGAAPASGGSAPLTTASTGFFDRQGPRTALPLAAFPGLTINHKSQAAAGVAAGSRGWFDFGASREESLRLMLNTVETYGLDVTTANKALTKYCQAPETSDICKEEVLRKFLKPLVANVLDQFADPITKSFRYAVSVRLIMVYRVYLAREILEQRKIGGSEGGSAQVGQATVKPSGNAPDTMEQRIAALEERLSNLQTGGALMFSGTSGTDMLLDVKFTRPVAIGYRGIPYEKQAQ